MKTFRKRVFYIIQPDSEGSIASRLFDCAIASLILISSVIVFVVTFDLPSHVNVVLLRIEQVASVVFTVEYLLRIFTADYLFPETNGVKARFRYVCSPMAIVDLVAILPFWLPMLLPCSMIALRTLRLVRLLRILKLNRYFAAVQSIGQVLKDKRRELIGSLFFVMIVMLVSSLLMYTVEHDAQPNVFKNAFSGFWWAVATLTTVGYGDIYPITVLGRILGAFIAFSGIAALAIPTGIITAGMTERIGGGADVKDELNRQRNKDEEHDRLLQELGEVVKNQAAQVTKILDIVKNK